MHGRLAGIPHNSQEYVERIRAGLADVTWPGRCQKLQDHPAVFVDGAINAESAQSLVQSLEGHLNAPVISIIGVPNDKDYRGVFAALGPVSNAFILTETERNPSLHFLSEAEALEAARPYNADVRYAKTLGDAVNEARTRAGENGTILIVGTQSIVAETMVLWNQSFEVI